MLSRQCWLRTPLCRRRLCGLHEQLEHGYIETSPNLGQSSGATVVSMDPAIPPQAMFQVSVEAEVIGTGADGTEPSVLFSVQRHGQYSDDVKVLKRYLFNCGEGTQRLAGENCIKLRSLDAMYFTRFDVKSVSGVPGVIFALGSCGAATLQLHGPVGVRGFLGSIRSFVRRKYPQIKCVEISATRARKRGDTNAMELEEIESEEWTEGDDRKDQHTIILPVALGAGGVVSKQCLLCAKGAPQRQQPNANTASISLKDEEGYKITTTQRGRRREDESDEHESFREWLVQFYTEKVPEKIPYVDVVLNRYRGRYEDLKLQLCNKYGAISEEKSSDAAAASESRSDSSSDSDSNDDDSTINYMEQPLDRRWLETFYKQHQPDKVPHVDRVLRQFSGREDTLKQMLLRKYGNSTSRIATIDAEAPRKKRKLLDSDDKEPLDVKHMPAKIYVNAESSRTGPAQENDSSSLCYVMQFQYAPYPVVWVVDCRTPKHFSELEGKFPASQGVPSCGFHAPSLVVHLSPPDIQAHPRYKQWMEALYSSSSPPEQLAFNGDALQSAADGTFSFAFVSSAKAVVKRAREMSPIPQNDQPATPMTSLTTYLETSSWPEVTPCQRQIVTRVKGSDHEVHIAQGKLRFRLIQAKNLQLGFSYERTGWHKKAVEVEEGDNSPADQQRERADSCTSTYHNQIKEIVDPRKLIVLGTGSASPSKLRASSGIYLELSGTTTADVESMLVDCGEGTFGQLWRQFGSKVAQRIGGLRCIWISHNHADHHCGLVRVVYEYWRYHCHKGGAQRPLVVVAPQSVLSYLSSWLPQFALDGSAQTLIQLVTCSDFNDLQHPLRLQLLSEIGHAVTSFESVRVFHCYDSYGLVLTLQGGKKLVYSGDTKPCNQLVVAGMDAELLVHEATFDDTMEEDALKKKHSTVGQALDIARRMRAKHVILTHFSQRYPSLPPSVPTNQDGGNAAMGISCAYDGYVHAMLF